MGATRPPNKDRPEPAEPGSPVRAIFGIPIETDPTLPLGWVEFRKDGATLGRFLVDLDDPSGSAFAGALGKIRSEQLVEPDTLALRAPDVDRLTVLWGETSTVWHLTATTISEDLADGYQEATFTAEPQLSVEGNFLMVEGDLEGRPYRIVFSGHTLTGMHIVEEPA